MSTYKSQYFNQKPAPPPQQQPPQPPSGFINRAWDGTKWAVGRTVRGIAQTAALPFNPVGYGIGSGMASGVKREFEQMVQPDGPLVSQLQESLEQALLRQAPDELIQLSALIKKSLENTDNLTNADVRSIDAYLKMLFDDQARLLKHLAPDLNADGTQLFQEIAQLFNAIAGKEDFLNDFKENIKEHSDRNPTYQNLQRFSDLYNAILNKNQGAIIKAMSFLRQALVSDEQGILSEAVEVLKRKATDENNGLMKKVVDQLTELLYKQDGPLDLLTYRLTGSETSIIGQAVTLLKEKLLEKEGIIDQLGKRFNDEQEGIIVNALAIAKKSINETLESGLALLKEELTSEKGLMATLKAQVSGNEDSVLKQAITLLNESLYHPDTGIVPKLRHELTSEKKGMLVEALSIFAKALNDEKEGILVNGVALLKRKLLTDEDGILVEAIRLLEHKINGKEGVVENLQHKLINEHDGVLIQALHFLQTKLNDEGTGLIAEALALLEKRLLSENGLLDSLEKRLTQEETGILAKAVESMKKALEQKDGPLDLLSQSVQTLLNDSLTVLKNKCLDEKEGLLAQTLELATKKLTAENGLLDTLSKRLNDPKEGIIAQTITTLNNKLLEENGPLDLLQKKLLDEKEGILAKAIDLLTLKIQQVDGPLDVIQKRLVDKDGILDQALNMLQERLTNADKGILAQAKHYLSAALTDEKEGILVQAIDLLNRKLHENGGVIDRLDTRLTHKDTGILSRAAGILQEKLMAQGGLIDQLDDRLTGQAHPLLSNSRKKLTELRRAIISKNKAAIKKSSKELHQYLEQLTAQTALVFNKKPLSAEDQILIDQLKTELPAFSSEAPPDQSHMLVVVEAGLAAINRYYGSYEGIAARTATILQDTITEALDPLLERVENMPKKMVNNLFGVPEGASDSASGGTVSQFLGTGGSILKDILSKGVQAVSKQTLASFSSILAFGIQQALKKMEDTPAFGLPRQTLDGILSAIDAVKENGSWSDLYQNLVRASEALKPVKIYINGFHIPKIGSSEKVGNAERIYSDNLNVLREAIDTPPAESANQDWKTLAEAEKTKLIDNTTKFLTIKHIYEDVCKLKLMDERFYMRLLKKSKEKPAELSDAEFKKLSDAERRELSDAKLKKLFFEELENSRVSFITMLFAKLQYFFYNSIVSYYTEEASKVYFDEIFDYIKQHKAEEFGTLRSQVITNFTRYLTILGDAYENVAKNPTSTVTEMKPKGTLTEMLEKELEKKESNLGFEIKDLYLEFAQSIVHKTIGKGLLGWIGKKLIGNPEEIIRSIIDKSIESMQDANGYTHALNSVIREQLEEIWKLLQINFVQSPNHPAAATPPELSDLRKNELSGLVKNLFEILSKSKCQTKKDLRALIKGKLLSAEANKAIDDLFIEEVIEKVTNILATTIQSLIQEDQLQKLTYKFASLVNHTFEAGNDVTKEQMLDEEREIAKLSGQILQFTVNTAVEEKFDFTGKKQQTETNRNISDLHNLSTEFFVTTGQDLLALSKMDLENAFTDPLAFKCYKNKINKVIENTYAYESECMESNFQAKSSKANYDNIDEISKRYLGIAEQSQPLVQAITKLKQHSKTLENIQTVVTYLSQIQTIASAIPLRLSNPGGPTNEDLTFCENQLAILETHLEEIKKMRSLPQFVEQMATETRTFATILVDLRKANQVNLFCTAQTQTGSLLDQIVNEKKQSLGSTHANAALKSKLKTFEQEVLNAFDDTDHPELLRKLQIIEEATVPQQVDTAYQEFLGLCRQAMSQATLLINTQRGNYHQFHQRVLTAISGTHLLEPNREETIRKGIRESIAHAHQHLQALAIWEKEHIKQVPYINLQVVDMKGLQDWASGLVYHRVSERLNGFIGFLKRGETYRFGVLNHLFLIPYVQAMQETKKPKKSLSRRS